MLPDMSLAPHFTPEQKRQLTERIESMPHMLQKDIARVLRISPSSVSVLLRQKGKGHSRTAKPEPEADAVYFDVESYCKQPTI